MKKLSLIFVGLLLLTACGKEKDIGKEEIQYSLPPEGGVVDPDNGKETWFAFGPIGGVDETPANGVVQSHGFENGHYLHTIQLNISIPDDGYYYQGWLEKDGDLVSTGHMNNRWGDTRHSLRFETGESMQDYLNVVVSLERDDGNPAIGKRVAEGKLKVTQR